MEKIQDKVKKFCEENDLNSPIECRTLDTMSELGELSKEILKTGNYGKEEIKTNEKIKYEIGDLLYSIITMANYFKIDLEEALDLVIGKYEKRMAKGSPGSEND